jgi:integrase
MTRTRDDRPIMPEGRLSAIAIKNMPTKAGLYLDSHNLYLQVSRWGTKSYIFRYWAAGRERKMGLGGIHEISLAQAREEAVELRAKLRRGIDPIEERKAARGLLKAEAAKAMTFGECALAYFDAHRPSWRSPEHAKQWLATIAETQRGSQKFPALTAAINDLPVSAIDTGLVLKVIEPLWAKTAETAMRVRQRIEAILSWAAVRGYRQSGDNPARWRGHLDQTLPKRSKVAPVQHFNAIPYSQMAEFMGDLRAQDGTAARALEFLILCASRAGEVINARWSEIDLEGCLWVVPGSRMKAGREHRVPLSESAAAVLEALPRDGDFVLPGSRPNHPLGQEAMLRVARSIRPGVAIHVHGFRSTFRDWAAEQTSYPNELCEIALAHAVSDKTEAAYRRGDMMEKRRRMMADWAAYCERPPAADNVIVLAGRA